MVNLLGGLKFDPSIFVNMVWVIVILFLLAVVAIPIIRKKQLRWTVIFNDLSGGGMTKKRRAAKEYTTRKREHGLLVAGERNFEKAFLGMPPNEAIIFGEPDIFGEKKEVECYETADGQRFWEVQDIKTKGDLDSKEIAVNIKEYVPETKKYITRNETMKVADIVKGLTPVDRTETVNVMKEAYERRENPKWKELMPLIGAGIAITVLVLVFVFWGRINATAANAMAKSVQLEEIRLKETEIWRDIEYDVQVIKERTGIGNVTRPREPIPD